MHYTNKAEGENTITSHETQIRKPHISRSRNCIIFCSPTFSSTFMMSVLFGLLVMGGVTAATSLFLQVPVDGVLGIVNGASELSTAMLVLGAVLLGFGLYMRTWSD